MSTPTPRTKPIDLSKCKVGQRVKLRNGDETCLAIIHSARYAFPYVTASARSYSKTGSFRIDAIKDPQDIIAILPLPKKEAKKASGMPAEKPLKMTNRERELHNGQINKVIEQLKGLLKP